METTKNTVSEQLQKLQRLMHRASFQRGRGRGRGHNPFRGQGRVLALLKLKPEINQRELKFLLNMSKQGIAEIISKLEKNGYVTREASEDDKRVMTIKLTDEGAKAADEMAKRPEETTKMLDCLSDEELQNLSNYLERIIKQYEELFTDDDFEEHRRMHEEHMMHGSRDCGHGHGRGHGRGHHHRGGCREHDNRELGERPSPC